jgi:tripartite-type tricarboxylate transporter receptor subunit TctC
MTSDRLSRQVERRSDYRIDRREFLQAAGGASIATIAGCISSGSGADEAGDWEPTQTVRWIIPYDQGGGTDVYARGIIEALIDAVGEPIEVDNVPGGGGMNGYSDLMGSEPDGHTMLGNTGPLEVAPQILGDPDFDQRDATGIGVFGESAWTLIINAEYADEVDDLTDVIEKHNSGEWETLAVQELGSPQDIIALLTKFQFDEYDWQWSYRVPYTGTGPIGEAVASGEVPVGIVTDSAAQPVVSQTVLA